MRATPDCVATVKVDKLRTPSTPLAGLDEGRDCRVQWPSEQQTMCSRTRQTLIAKPQRPLLSSFYLASEPPRTRF